jgi:hypothetical protein
MWFESGCAWRLPKTPKYKPTSRESFTVHPVASRGKRSLSLTRCDTNWKWMRFWACIVSSKTSTWVEISIQPCQNFHWYRTQRTIDMARSRPKRQKASEPADKKHHWKYAGFDAFNVRPLLLFVPSISRSFWRSIDSTYHITCARKEEEEEGFLG